MSRSRTSAPRSERERSRARRRKRLDVDFEIFAREAGPRWKSLLFGFCFLIPAGLIIAYALAEAGAMFESLRMEEPIIDTSSSTFGIISIALSLAGIGVLGVIGATRSRWMFRNTDKFFIGILVFFGVGLVMMIMGGSINAKLLGDRGYIACDKQLYNRMTTTLWASRDRGCEGVTYSTWRPI